MNPDTLAIVPSKGRSHLIPRLVDGIRNTAEEPVDILLVVNQTERTKYLQHSASDVSIMLVANDFNYPRKLNAGAAAALPRHRYLALWNDDHEPITPGWDRAFKDAIGDEPYGMAYGNDGVWAEGQVPSAPFLTKSFYNALGWVALPGLQHILVDNVWMDLAKALDVCHYLPGVRVEHHHIDNGGAAMDKTYIETNRNEKRNQQDRERWWAWLESDERTENENALAELWTPAREIRRPE